MSKSTQAHNELIAQLLERRGIVGDDARAAFLAPQYGTYDPFLLPDMPQAVKRIKQAQQNQEVVAIYGDYDIDGITATTLLLDAFAQFGITSISHIPNRFTEGYGMSRSGIDEMHEAGATLIVTVDCGTVSVDEVAYAASLGIDVVITDHHSPGSVLPDAVAVVNPKREINKYPFKDFAGVGVAFKLVQALQQKMNGLESGQEKWLLDLVAFGTVCDIVSLTGENRMLVHYGLKVLRKTKRAGFKALADVAGVQLSEVQSATLGFVFGPRLNAAGRLETAKHSLDLMRSTEQHEAIQYATRLEGFNQERRSKQALMIAEAEKKAAAFEHDPVLIISSPEWAEGVVGIVASKMVERYKKPAFMIAELGDTAKGSGRSFGDFSIVDAVRASEHTLIKGGGHAFAGGITLKTQNVDDFRKAINTYHHSLQLSDQQHYLAEKADLDIADFSLIDELLVEALAALEPFGKDNPQPLFRCTNVTIADARLIGADKKHVKAVFQDELGSTLPAIAFGKGEVMPAVGEVISPLIKVTINEFRGSRIVQAQVLEF